MSKGITHQWRLSHHDLTMLCMNEAYEMEHNRESEIQKVLIDNETDDIVDVFCDISSLLVTLGGAFNYRPSLLFSMMNGELMRDDEDECIGCEEYMDFDDDGTDEY